MTLVIVPTLLALKFEIVHVPFELMVAVVVTVAKDPVTVRSTSAVVLVIPDGFPGISSDPPSEIDEALSPDVLRVFSI